MSQGKACKKKYSWRRALKSKEKRKEKTMLMSCWGYLGLDDKCYNKKAAWSLKNSIYQAGTKEKIPLVP